MKADYQFTQDWFSWSPPVWDQVFKQLDVRKILEIGCFEGRATTWLIENVKWQKDPKIICVDTFEGGEEHDAKTMAGVKGRFTHNIWVALQKTKLEIDIEVLEVPSHKALKQIKTMFEFIYIDGSHVAKDVLTDACMAWPMLREGGVMCFDDYGWGAPFKPTHKPKLAIDAFIDIFQEDLEVIHKGYQLIVQKVN